MWNILDDLKKKEKETWRAKGNLSGWINST